MWFYSRTLWIYILPNSIMVSSKKNNDLHVTDRNWKSLSSSSSLKPLGFAPNHQAFLKWCALDDFQQRSGPFVFRLWLGQLLFCNDGCKTVPVPGGFLRASSSGPISFGYLGGGWTLQSFPVWRLSLPFNLLRHTEPAAVPFKLQPLLLLSTPTFMLTSAPRWELPWRFPHGCLEDGIGAERGAGLL